MLALRVNVDVQFMTRSVLVLCAVHSLVLLVIAVPIGLIAEGAGLWAGTLGVLCALLMNGTTLYISQNQQLFVQLDVAFAFIRFVICALLLACSMYLIGGDVAYVVPASWLCAYIVGNIALAIQLNRGLLTVQSPPKD